MKKIRKNNKGFSLVELIIVIAIMGALIAIVAPQYVKYVNKSRVSADLQLAEQVLTAVNVALTETDIEVQANEKVTISKAAGTVVSGSPTAKANLATKLEASLGKTLTDVKAQTATSYVITIKGTTDGFTAVGDWTPQN